jgi:small-conductance mechanosensitive channel
MYIWINQTFSQDLTKLEINLILYFIIPIIVTAGFVILGMIKGLIFSGVKKKYSLREKNSYRDKLIQRIESIGFLLYFAIILYFSKNILISLGLPINFILDRAINVLTIFAISIYFIGIIQAGISYLLDKYNRQTGRSKELDLSVISLINYAIDFIIWAAAGIFIFDMIGLKVDTLVAGLGVSGIVIAFALQKVMLDLFASFSIYLDKPFKIGDFINTSDIRGTVEKVGIKSTRIKSIDGEEIVISNSELTENVVHNYAKMRKRRISFNLNLSYDTPNSKLRQIPGMIQEIVEKQEKADFDRAHFKEFGEIALVYEVVYFVKTGDYTTYMDIQQEINFAIKETLEKNKIKLTHNFFKAAE